MHVVIYTLFIVLSSGRSSLKIQILLNTTLLYYYGMFYGKNHIVLYCLVVDLDYDTWYNQP